MQENETEKINIPNYLKECTWNNFPNIGYMKTKLTEEEVAPILNEVEKIRMNFDESERANQHLAGNIEYEFALKDSFEYIQTMMSNIGKLYLDTYSGHYASNKIHGLQLGRTWVNFQKKGEFNPVHVHSGNLSFVIFLKIPFYKEKELELWSKTKERNKVSGNFCFLYTNSLGRIVTNNHKIDKNDELTVYLFDATMSHQVYPFFTSDDYRITISGNLYFKLPPDEPAFPNLLG